MATDDDNPKDRAARAARARVANIFATGQLRCAEAVLVVVNRGLQGELSDAMATRLASGFPEGLGTSGCLCGAVSGAVMVLGLFLGRSGPGLVNERQVKSATTDFMAQFKARFRTSCCRILTRELAYGSRSHFQHCAEISGETAEMAVHLILQHKPDLIRKVDWDYLSQVDSGVRAGIRKLAGILK
jgi:C_GCAxxG_C_C family probable redox protein